MAKQVDLYKAINKLSKELKQVRQFIDAVDSLAVFAYTPEMRSYVTRQMIKDYNRYVKRLTINRKLRSLLGMKPKEIPSLIVKNPNN